MYLRPPAVINRVSRPGDTHDTPLVSHPPPTQQLRPLRAPRLHGPALDSHDARRLHDSADDARAPPPRSGRTTRLHGYLPRRFPGSVVAGHPTMLQGPRGPRQRRPLKQQESTQRRLHRPGWPNALPHGRHGSSPFPEPVVQGCDRGPHYAGLLHPTDASRFWKARPVPQAVR